MLITVNPAEHLSRHYPKVPAIDPTKRVDSTRKSLTHSSREHRSPATKSDQGRPLVASPLSRCDLLPAVLDRAHKTEHTNKGGRLLGHRLRIGTWRAPVKTWSTRGGPVPNPSLTRLLGSPSSLQLATNSAPHPGAREGISSASIRAPHLIQRRLCTAGSLLLTPLPRHSTRSPVVVPDTPLV